MTYLMHHHIYKNAGTTVDWLLQRNFPGRVLHVESDRSGARLTNEQVRELAEQNPDNRCVSSHATALPAAGWAVCHLVLLRDPLARFRSMYQFGRRHEGDSPDSRRARRLDFNRYLLAWIERASGSGHNWQTKCCTAQTDETMRRYEGWYGDLDTAKRLTTDVALAGTVDRFDETMVLLEHRLAREGIYFDASYLAQNISLPHKRRFRVFGLGNTDPEKNLSAEVRQRFLETNSQDYELVTHVRALVDERMAQVDPDGARLQDLRRRCERLRENGLDAPVLVPGLQDAILLPGPAPQTEDGAGSHSWTGLR